MTTRPYTMESLNLCVPSDVIRWVVRMLAVGDRIYLKDIKPALVDVGLHVNPAHFAASSLCKYFDDTIDFCVYMDKSERIAFGMLDANYIDNIDIVFSAYLNGNPFEGLTMPDGAPRTSATRDEIEAWLKEMRG